MRDKILRIYPDMDPESPREWDNLGTIFMTGMEKYSFNETSGGGDWLGFIEHEITGIRAYADIEDKMSALFDRDEGEYWQVIERLFDEFFVWLPLYYNGHKLYFRNEEEGMIFIARTDLEKEKLSEKRALEVFKAEIETLNQYLTGEVYGYELVDTDDAEIGDHIDSCWGFYGEDIYTNGITDHVNMAEVKRIEYMTPCTIHSYEAIHTEELENDNKDQMVERCA